MTADANADFRARFVKAKKGENPFAKGKPAGGAKFPITDEASLKKAIRLAPKDDFGVRAYIKKRAAALGLSKLIPSSWS